LIRKGGFVFKTETDFFKLVMERYFRKIPPIPTNLYLNLTTALNEENRIKIASLCHFPSVINTLVRDKNYRVIEAALKNDFWVLVGELQDVLGFGKKERKEFARQEVFTIILVLLLFEDDLDVIGEVLRNASVSTQMLSIFIRLMEERGRGQKDQQILKEARKILGEKKQRILKASEIQKSRKKLLETTHQQILLHKLADDDKVIRKAVHNILTDMDPALLIDFVQQALNNNAKDEILPRFIILSELLQVVEKREDLRHMVVSALEINRPLDPEFQNNSLSEYFIEVINRHRLRLLDQCQEDLTNFQHVLLLTNCHCDPADEIRTIAENILSIDDIFILVNDTSTPQEVFKAILDILSEHPLEEVHERVEATYHEESERLWTRLKELEQTINAYFDIIFQSLGFTQINEYNVSVKTLEQAEKTIDHLIPKLDESTKQKISAAKPVFAEIKKAVEMHIYEINANTSPAGLKDLYHIQDIIQQIFELKNIGKEGLRPGVMSDIDPAVLEKAVKIWQSALGQFLGRIKHLNEMIKIKFSILANEIEKHEIIQTDFIEIVETFESNHKKSIKCDLKIACVECAKRGCSSERFLTETQFFIDELLDNFIDEPQV
jgi:vacuolar-type H+-ATPase subunit H